MKGSNFMQRIYIKSVLKKSKIKSNCANDSADFTIQVQWTVYYDHHYRISKSNNVIWSVSFFKYY